MTPPRRLNLDRSSTFERMVSVSRVDGLRRNVTVRTHLRKSTYGNTPKPCNQERDNLIGRRT